MCSIRVAAAAVVLAGVMPRSLAPVRAANQYWDTNGSTSGAGGSTPTGTWSTTVSNWSLDSGGGVTTAAWGAGNAAFFAAGADATGTYTVTTSGVLLVSGITFEEGNVTVSGAGALSLTSSPTVTVASGASATISSSMNGIGQSLTKAGAGVLTLSGSNGYDGGTVINAGTLQVFADGNLGNSSGGVTLDGGALATAGNFTTSRIFTMGAGGGTFAPVAPTALTINSALAANANSLTKIDNGDLILTTSSSRTGTTTISSGGLRVNHGSALGSGSITVNGTGTLRLAGVSVGQSLSLANSGMIHGFSSTSTYAGTVTVAGSSTPTLSSGIVNTLVIGDGVNDYTGGSGATTSVIGTGVVILPYANDYQGNWSISGGGTLQIPADYVLGGAGGSIAFNNGTLATTANLSSARGITLNAGAGTFSPSAATIATFSGVIGGTGGLNKTNDGTLVLSGANTYSGGTIISNGVIVAGVNNALPVTTNLVTNGGYLGINLPGGSQTVASLSGSSGGIGMSPSGTLIVNQTIDTVYSGHVYDTNFFGPSSDTGALVKQGSGKLTLDSDDNVYGGGTTISGGTLQIGNGGTTGAVAGNITNNAALIFDRSNDYTYTGIISGGGALTKSGAGRLTTNATHTFTGVLLVAGGEYALPTGVITPSATTVGDTAAATFTQTGGTHLITSTALAIGNQSGSSGVYTLSAGALHVASGAVIVGNSGSGQLTLSGTGILTAAGGNDVIVGSSGSGAVTQSGGTANITNGLRLASSPGAVGSYNMTGGALSAGAVTVGAGGAATFTQSGGTHTVAGATVVLGSLAGSSGIYALSGAGSLATGHETIGNNGAGTFTQSGGANAIAGDLYIGRFSGSSGVYNLSAGSLSTGSLYLGAAGSGTFSQSGGTTAVSGLTTVFATSGSGMTLSAGAFSTGSLAGAGPISTGINLTVGSDNTNSTYSGVMSGAGGLTKIGTGVFTISGNNTYAGGTTVSAGTLVLDHANPIGTGALTLADTSTLKGKNSGAVITLNNTVSLPSGTATVSIPFSQGDDLIFNGVISGSGALRITSDNPGRWLWLNAANTFTGGVLMDGSSLTLPGIRIGHASALGTGTLTSTITRADGGNRGGRVTIEDESLNIVNAMVIDTGARLTVNTQDYLTTFSGVISGPGTLQKMGNGLLRLTGTNTYTGGTSLLAGTLRIGADANLGNASGGLIFNGGLLDLTNPFATSRAIILNSSGGSFSPDTGTNTFNGIISGSGALNKVDLGAIRLNGANTYTGGTSITGGTVVVSADNNLGNSSGALTLSGGTFFTVGSFSTPRSVTLGGGSGTYYINTATTLTAAGVISGSGSLTKAGSGTLVLAGANTYSGDTIVALGTLQPGAANSIPSAGVVKMTGSAGTLDLAGFDQSIKSLYGTASGTTVTNSSGTAAMLTLNVPNGGESNAVYYGLISGNLSLVLNNFSTATQTLKQANTYNGSTTINSGNLYIDTSNAIPTGSAVTIGATGGLNLGGHQQSVASLTGSGSVTLSTGTFTVSSSSSSTFAGVIGSGAGPMNKAGSGTWTLAGSFPNTNTGTTNVNAGTLQLAKSNGVNAVGGNVVVNSAGTLKWYSDEQIPDTATLTLNVGGTVNLNGHIETVMSFIDNGGVTLLGGGSLETTDLVLTDGSGIGTNTDLAGNLSYIGAVTAASISGNLTLGSGVSNHQFNINNGVADPDVDISGTITATTNIIKSGAGTIRLSGLGSSVGDLLVNAGQVKFAGGSFTSTHISFVESGGALSAGNVTNTGSSVFVGDGSNNFVTLDHTGGTLTTTGLFVGRSSSSGGFYNLSGSGLISVGAGGTILGGYGTGTINQSGGTFTTTTLIVGGNSIGPNFYNLSAGALNVSGAMVAANTNSATGTFYQTGGTSTFAGGITLGNTVNGSGVFSISGGTARIIGNANVGATGAGTLRHFGGTTTITGDLSLGISSASGSAMITGGILTVGATVYVGPSFGSNSGTGTLTQSGGTLTSANGFQVNVANAAGSGSYSISGGALNITNSLGIGAAGIVNQSGGAVTTTGGGGVLAVNGVYTLSSAAGASTLTTSTSQYIADGGTGTFSQSGGTNNVGGNLIVGRSGGALQGRYDLSGGVVNVTGQTIVGGESGSATGFFNLVAGTLNATSGETIGNTGTGTFTQSGGTHAVTGTLILGASSGVSGRYTTTGGNVTATNVYLGGNSSSASAGTGIVDINTGGTFTATGTLKIWNSGSSALNIAGGRLTVASLAVDGHPERVNWTSGTVELASDDLIVGAGGALGSTPTVGANKSLILPGGTQNLRVGDGTNSSLTITGGGTAYVANALRFGTGTGFQGDGTVGAGSMLTVDGTLTVGDAATATLTVQSGGIVDANNLHVGSSAGADGTLAVNSGASVIVDTGMSIGGTSLAAGGAGHVTVAGSLDVAGALKVWNTATTSFTVSGGTAAASGMDLEGGTNTVQAAGSLIARSDGLVLSGNTGPALALHSDTASPGVLSITGGITFSGASGTGAITSSGASGIPGTIDLNGATQTISVADGSAGTDLNITARLSNGGITKTGAGTLNLAGSNQYEGPTNITAGAVTIGSSGGIPAASALTISGGSSLSLAGNFITVASLADLGSGNSGTILLGTGTLSAGDNSSTTFNGAISGSGGGIRKLGNGTLTLAGTLSQTGANVVDLGVLRVTGNASSLGGSMTVNGTGPSFGTLSLASDNLGSATLTFAGGHIASEASFNMPRAITLGVGGGSFDITSGHTVTLSGAIAGTGGLTKDDPGTLVLAHSANTYGGQTLIAGGTLKTFAVGALPSGSAVNMDPGTQLQLLGNNQTVASLAGAGAVDLGAATLTSGGNDATTQFSASIVGSGGIIKNGSGTLTLAGAISFSGGVVVNAGTLELDGTGSFAGGISVASGASVRALSAAALGAATNTISIDAGTFAAGGTFTAANPIALSSSGGYIVVDAGETLTQTGAISGSGAIGKTGSGTLRFQTSQTPASTVLTIEQGKLALSDNGSLASSSISLSAIYTGGTLELDNSVTNLSDRFAGQLQIAGGAFNFIGADSTTSSESIDALTLTGGAASILLQQGVGGSTAVTFAGISTLSGATLDITAPGAGTTNKLLITGHPTGFLGGWAVINGADFAKYDTAQGVIPLSPGEYSSSFTSGAHVRRTNNGSTGSTLSIKTLALDTSSNTVSVSLGGQLTLTEGGLLKTGSNTASISGSTINNNTSNVLNVFTSGGALTVSSALAGTMDVSKNGSGLLELTATSGSHNFSGDVYLNAGTLRISSNSNLGTGTNGLVFNGGTLQAGGTFTFGSSRSLLFNGIGGTIDTNGNSVTVQTTDQFTGSGAMSKSGGGTLIANSANAFSGPVTVNAGVLQLGNVDAFNDGGVRSIITLAPSAQLNLRSDADPAVFGNDVVILDNTPATPAIINIGPVSNATAGLFKLGALRIGDGTLQSAGASGSLEFQGIVTLRGDARFDSQRPLSFTDRITGVGSLAELGSATMTFGSGASDFDANTYSGDTIISAGTLQLNKAAGTIAIPGDVVLSGGTLVLLQPRQIADSATLSLGGGTFDMGGQSDAVDTLVNTGATIIVNGAALTVGTTTFAGGITTIGATPLPPPIGAPELPPAVGIDSSLTTDILSVSDGVTTVNPGGSLNIGSGGLFFSGANSPTVTLVGNATTPGQIVLTGDVTNNCPSGTAQIVNSGATTIAGTISMADAIRTFSVASVSSDLRITARITRGGVRKSGTGKLVLTQRSDYALGTTIAAGTLEACDGALGSGPVALQSGTLNLRSDAASAAFLNDVVASNATIDIDRITPGVTRTIKMGRLTIGSNTLTVNGANGGTLEFSGPVQLTGANANINGTATVLLSNAITGNSGITKNIGAGTLRFAGAVANAHTGVTRVNAGVIELAKPAGVIAVPANLSAFTGGVVRWQANDQVVDNSLLTVNGSGSQVDLNGFTDTIGAVNMTGGTISTGAGTLRLLGDVTTNASTNVATISGNVDLGVVMHTFTVGDSISSPVDDLVVSANVIGAGGIIKAGAGTLVLSGSNSFTGGVTVTGGTLKTSGNSAFAGAQSIAVNAGALDMPGQVAIAEGAVLTKTGAGTLSISGTQNHAAGSHLVVQQGALNVNTDAGSPGTRTLDLSATGGSVVFNATQHLNNLNIGSGVTASVTPGGGKIVYTSTLALAGSGKLDMADGTLIVATGQLGEWSGSAYTGVRGLVNSGRNGGAWNGSGIVTSQPNALSAMALSTLGVASAAELGVSTFDGQTVAPGAILVKYTYAGDADLDGQIDGDDYFQIDSNVSKNGTVFGTYRGDFDANGLIDADDYFLIDRNFARQGQFVASPPALAGVSAVPEPGAFAAIVGAGISAIRRRRR